MRVTVLAVGSRMPGWVTEGVDEYSKRLPREWQFQWVEVSLARRGKDADAGRLREAEGEKLLRAIPDGDTVIALDVKGKRLATEDLARALGDWQMSGNNYTLVIGGPDGLSPAVMARADQRWSLSDMTLPHPLVRIIVAEQLYRAWTITVNHPYHRT